MVYGSRGRITSYYHGNIPDQWDTDRGTLGGGWNYTSLNEGSFAHVTDEPGGLLQVTNDTADLDMFAAFAGPYRPADGGILMEARFKAPTIANNDYFVGFTETLSMTSPVLPATHATSSMTYAGTGGMIGFNYDEASTTSTWRALGGDGGSVVSGADANGTVTTEGAPVDDQFDLIRVEIDTNGEARLYHDGVLIKTIAASGSITPGDNFYAVLMAGTTSSGTAITEIDYLLAEAYRDWTL